MKYYDVSDLGVAASGLMKGIYLPWMTPGLHRHGEVEINLLERGSVRYIFGGTSKDVGEGEIALFWAAIPHQIIQCEESTILHWLNVPFNMFLQWQLPHALTQKIVCGTFICGSLEGVEERSLPALFQRWGHDLDTKSPEYQKVVLLEVEAFLHRFALSASFTETTDKQSEVSLENTPQHKMSKVEQMANFIVKHYTEPIHVQEVADAVYLHPNYAMNIFRQYFGISILDYITQYRLSHAQRLLITTDDNILEIVMASGFGSTSNFYTIFKHASGLSPRAYRATYSLTEKQRKDINFR